MTRENIERELDKLTLELARVKMMDEQEACEFCNVDSKAEAIGRAGNARSEGQHRVGRRPASIQARVREYGYVI